MKRFEQTLVLVVSIAFLAACGQQEVDSPEAGETSSDGVYASSDQGLASSYYVEYIWCSSGANANEESMAALLADTNRLVDEYGGESLNGYRLHPNGWTSDEFDYIDALWWPDKEVGVGQHFLLHALGQQGYGLFMSHHLPHDCVIPVRPGRCASGLRRSPDAL